FGLAAAGLGSDAPLDRATLRGLNGLKVLVDVGTELQQAGITTANLWPQVEQRLSKAGISVDRNALEFVGVRLSAAHSKNTPYALCVELAIYQGVSLRRDPKTKTTTETWSTQSVLLAPPKSLHEAVANTVDQLVDQFIDAFRSANSNP